MADKVIYWSKTALTGGAAGALDSIDGTALQDGEVAHVWMSNVLYIYLLDVDSGAAESSPAIIAPDTNAGDKRWILQSYYSGSGTLYTDHIAESTAGHGVEIDGLTLKDSGLAIGSDADGDMYYRASSKLARLEKGAAYKHLGMNSGATAPEWQASANSVLTAAGDILYASSANTLARLAKGTANHKFFMNAGATAPEWAAGIKAVSFTRVLNAADGDVANATVGFKPSALIVMGLFAGGIALGMSCGNEYYCYSIYGTGPTYAIGGTAYEILRFSDGTNIESGVLKTFDSSGFTITWTKTNNLNYTAYITVLCFR